MTEFPTAGIAVDLLQNTESSTLIVDVGYGNYLSGNIQVSVNSLSSTHNKTGRWNCNMGKWFSFRRRACYWVCTHTFPSVY